MAQEITGSNPVARPITNSILPFPPGFAPVAQWREHWASDPGVAGSTPARRATPFPQFSRYYETLAPFGFSATLKGNSDFIAMLPTHRNIWLLGHFLSMQGYVDAA